MADGIEKSHKIAEDFAAVAKDWFQMVGIPDEAIPSLLAEYAKGTPGRDGWERIADEWHAEKEERHQEEWRKAENRRRAKEGLPPLPPLPASGPMVVADLEAEIHTQQVEWMSEPDDRDNRFWAPVRLRALWNKARQIPNTSPPPRLTIPFNGPVKSMEEALGAADDLLAWCQAEKSPRKAVAGTPQVSAPSPPKPDFLFSRDEDGYQIAAFDVTKHMQAQLGLCCIEKLLRAQGKGVPWHELLADYPPERPTTAALGTVAGSVGSNDKDERHWSDATVDTEAGFGAGQSRQEVVDDETLLDLRSRLAAISCERQKATDNNDQAAIDRLDKECEHIRTYMQRAIGPRGMRTFDSDGVRKSKGIYNAIRRARGALKKVGFGKLAEHLEVAISAQSGEFSYSPSPAVAWSFDGQ